MFLCAHFTVIFINQVGIPNSRLRYFLIAKISTEDLNTQAPSKVRYRAMCNKKLLFCMFVGVFLNMNMFKQLLCNNYIQHNIPQY